MVAISCDKVAIKFIDEFCDYNPSRKSSFGIHSAADKHTIEQN